MLCLSSAVTPDVVAANEENNYSDSPHDGFVRRSPVSFSSDRAEETWHNSTKALAGFDAARNRDAHF